MEKKIIKEVLTKIVEIDKEAEFLRKQNDNYLTNKQSELRKRMHQEEIDAMSAARAKVKADSSKKVEEVNQQKLDIEEASAAKLKLVDEYFQRYKQELIEQLFNEIFEVRSING